MSVGLDCGTMNLVSARMGKDDKVVTRRVRNAFLELEPEAKKMLKLKKLPYVEEDGKVIVIDDAALSLANFLKRDVRRPLARGLISAGEIQAQSVLSLLISQVLGDPEDTDEVCYYSVPASPIDVQGQDVVFHEEVLRKIISSFGFKALPFNEAQAIVISNCEDFSGIGVSFGSGMANIALVFETILGSTFSLVNSGGDWIDQNAARAVGSTPTRICALKEAGVDLLNPKGTEQQAVAVYITAMVRNTIKEMARQLGKSEVAVSTPLPIIVSGGTSRATNFLPLFKKEFESVRSQFPLEVSDIRAARDPMTAVAEGLLALASQEELPFERGFSCTTTSVPQSNVG